MHLCPEMIVKPRSHSHSHNGVCKLNECLPSLSCAPLIQQVHWDWLARPASNTNKVKKIKNHFHRYLRSWTFWHRNLLKWSSHCGIVDTFYDVPSCSEVMAWLSLKAQTQMSGIWKTLRGWVKLWNYLHVITATSPPDSNVDMQHIVGYTDSICNCGLRNVQCQFILVSG